MNAEKGTQHQFGYQWNIYRTILPMYEEQFRRWIHPLTVDFFKGKRFLDAGCGIGRNSIWPLKAGAASAYSFDFDGRTVDAARENLRPFPNCEVAFQSIYDLKRNGEFDIAFSIGVIHHLPDPRRAVEILVESLKPGGTLILWLYAHEGNETYLTFVNPLRKVVTSRIPLSMTRLLARILSVPLWSYVRLPYRGPYLKMLRSMDRRHLESIAFDQLLPTIAHYWRRSEVMTLIGSLGLTDVELHHTNGMSWTLIAKKAQTQ